MPASPPQSILAMMFMGGGLARKPIGCSKNECICLTVAAGDHGYMLTLIVERSCNQPQAPSSSLMGPNEARKRLDRAGPDATPFVMGVLFYELSIWVCEQLELRSVRCCWAATAFKMQHLPECLMLYRSIDTLLPWNAATISWCDVLRLSFPLLLPFPYAETLLLADVRIHSSHAKLDISCRLRQPLIPERYGIRSKWTGHRFAPET